MWPSQCSICMQYSGQMWEFDCLYWDAIFHRDKVSGLLHWDVIFHPHVVTGQLHWDMSSTQLWSLDCCITVFHTDMGIRLL